MWHQHLWYANAMRQIGLNKETISADKKLDEQNRTTIMRLRDLKFSSTKTLENFFVGLGCLMGGWIGEWVSGWLVVV